MRQEPPTGRRQAALARRSGIDAPCLQGAADGRRGRRAIHTGHQPVGVRAGVAYRLGYPVHRRYHGRNRAMARTVRQATPRPSDQWALRASWVGIPAWWAGAGGLTWVKSRVGGDVIT